MMWMGLDLALLGVMGLGIFPREQEKIPEKPVALLTDPTKLPELTEPALKLPCAPEDWGLVVEDVFGYEGLYIEDGSFEPAENVAAVILHNAGQRGISFAVVALEQGTKTTYFSVTWLPAGERVLVLAMERGAYSDAPITGCRVLGIRWEDFDSASLQVQHLPENGFDVTNTLNAPQMGVRLRYKWYLQELGIYFGGVTHSVAIPPLAAGESYLIYPDTFGAEAIRVVANIK
jgi:hypothetical protein